MAFEKRRHTSGLAGHEGRWLKTDRCRFKDGTIGYKLKPSAQGAAANIVRRHDHDSGELLYERVGPDFSISQDCIQYAPIMNGNMLWDAYPEYQSPAPFNPDDWNHVTLVLSGRGMEVFVNGADTPTISVGHLESSAQEGQLEVLGTASYANLHISPGVVIHLPPTPLPDKTALTLDMCVTGRSHLSLSYRQERMQ